MRWVELGILAEIVDRSGTVRKTAGCSLVGRRQFFTRLARLNTILEQADQSIAWPDLFAQDTEFAHHITELFRLNTLDLDWFSPDQVEGLLFRSLDDEGNIQPGLLVVINSPKISNSDKQNNKPQTLVETIACLADDLEQALTLASELPADMAYGLNAAKTELALTPEEREAKERQRNVAEIKKNIDLMGMLTGG